MICSLGGFNIEYEGLYDGVEKLCANYMAEGKTDFSLTVTENDIAYEENVAEQKSSKRRLEATAFYRKLAEELPKRNAFVLHSSLFDVDGVGIALAAHSGTGKTTHTFLWQKLLGERMTIVNGDKPIVRFTENGGYPFGYGTPWNGKERLGCNTKTEIKHICFIERAKTNSCEKMDPKDAVDLIFNQVYMPKDPVAAINTIQLINRLINSCKLWKIRCNMDISAAQTAYNVIFNGDT